MKVIIILVGIVFLTCFSTFSQVRQLSDEQKNTIVVITTDIGNIKIKLYDETPLHRDNFIKLVQQGYYNGSIFHRVIKDFMIQGGRGADGSEDPGYTILPEFVSKYYHKRGAVCAARMPDNINPKKESSGSQFYIVQGKKFTPDEFNVYATRLNKKFTDEQIKDYTTIGGAPYLDGEYTVFGEVIEGMDVVDKIASVQVNPQNNHRPLKDVKMTMKIVEK